MTGASNDNPGNFANRPTEEVREIAAKGGRASHGGGSNAESDENESRSTGTANTNPGNFANRGGFASMDPEKQREIASMGGKASSGSFEPGSERAREAGRKGGSSTSDS
ncbi:putative conidiation-specific expression protein [Bombardia bombarda]|uniref:Conidiation-specific expression protein n=1 Tax=Bombardia bombarda TaxID=252184 RepID=A0AA40CGA3_9PEZI|nr:putative conidiation-specific expression protein [Bombardia bombarda]